MNGEQIYAQYCAGVRKEHPPEGTIESLRTVVNLIREYAIPEFPATENGQVPFFRTVFDSIVGEIEASIQRQETDRETADANWKSILAIPALCRGKLDVPCALHVSLPIRELYEKYRAVMQDLAEWVQLAKYQRDWFRLSHPSGDSAGPCPTDSAIKKSERLLGREVGYPPASKVNKLPEESK